MKSRQKPIKDPKKTQNWSDLAAVRSLLANPNIPVAEIARRFNVNPTTLYRAFPGGRSAVIEGSWRLSTRTPKTHNCSWQP